MRQLNPLSVFQADNRYARFKRPVDCLSSDSIGDSVYIRAGFAGGRWQVAKADPGDDAKMPAVGILISKSSTTEGEVQLWGEVPSIFSSLSIGRTYHVDYNGVTLNVPIIGVNGYSWVQDFGFALSDDILFLVGNIVKWKHR